MPYVGFLQMNAIIDYTYILPMVTTSIKLDERRFFGGRERTLALTLRSSQELLVLICLTKKLGFL